MLSKQLGKQKKKAAAERLNQAVMSGTDVKPPAASRAAARQRAYQIAKSELKKSISKRLGAEEAEFLASEIARFDASETPYTDEYVKARRGEMRARDRLDPRRRPSWSPDPADIDPRVKAARGAQLDAETLRRLRTSIPLGRFEGKPAYASPEAAENYFKGQIDTGPAPEGYRTIARGGDTLKVPTGVPLAKAQAAQRRAAAKAALKKYGGGLLTGADALFAAEAGYLGGKWAQDPLSRPSQLRKKMGLAGGIPLIQDAPEYIQSGEGFIDPPRRPDDPLYDPKWTPEKSVKHAGGWGITDIDTSAPITKYVASQLRGQKAPTPFKRKAGKAADDPEYLAKRQAQRDAGMRAGGYDPDDPASLALAKWDLDAYLAREGIDRSRIQQVVMEELGFGEGTPADDEWSKKKEYVVEEDSQLELPGFEALPTCIPASGVDDLSSQLAKMVVDSQLAPEDLNDLMELIYDKVAEDLEGIGVEDEEGSDEYRRTTMGFMESLKKATINVLIEQASEEPTEDTTVIQQQRDAAAAAAAKGSANPGTPEAEGAQAGNQANVAALNKAAQSGGEVRTGPAGSTTAKVATGQKNEDNLDEQGELNRWSTLAGIEAVEEKKQPSEKSAKKAHKALAKTAKKKFPGNEERQDRYIYGGKRNIGWKPKRERQ